MIVLTMVGYLLIGALLILSSLLFHMMYYEIKGYDAVKWWDECCPLMELHDFSTVIKFIWIFVLWPVTFVKLVGWYLPSYAKDYKLKD